MNPKAISFFLFSTIALLFSAARAQDRALHGLANENPVALSPAAVEFFHPKTQVPNTKNLCTESSSCSPLPLAAQVDDTQSEESLLSTSQKGGRGLGAGGIAGIVLGLTFVVLSAMGGFYIFISHRANSTRSNFVKPDLHA